MTLLPGFDLLLFSHIKCPLWLQTFLLSSLFIYNVVVADVLVELLLQHVFGSSILLSINIIFFFKLACHLDSIKYVSWDGKIGLIKHEKWLGNTTSHSADGLEALPIFLFGFVVFQEVLFEATKHLQLFLISKNIWVVELEFRILLQFLSD